MVPDSYYRIAVYHILTSLSSVQCPAIDYTRHTLDGAACLLNSNKYFPSRWVLPPLSCHSLYYGMWINRLEINMAMQIIFTTFKPDSWLHMSVLCFTHYCCAHEHGVLCTASALRSPQWRSWAQFVVASTGSSPMLIFTTGKYSTRTRSADNFWHVQLFCLAVFGRFRGSHVWMAFFSLINRGHLETIFN